MCVFSLRQRNAEHSNLLFSSKDGKILINFLRKATVPQSASLEQDIDVLISSSSCKGTARLFPEGTEGKRHHSVISGGHNKLWEMHWLSQEFLTGGTRVTNPFHRARGAVSRSRVRPRGRYQSRNNTPS